MLQKVYFDTIFIQAYLHIALHVCTFNILTNVCPFFSVSVRLLQVFHLRERQTHYYKPVSLFQFHIESKWDNALNFNKEENQKENSLFVESIFLSGIQCSNLHQESNPFFKLGKNRGQPNKKLKTN